MYVLSGHCFVVNTTDRANRLQKEDKFFNRFPYYWENAESGDVIAIKDYNKRVLQRLYPNHLKELVSRGGEDVSILDEALILDYADDDNVEENVISFDTKASVFGPIGDVDDAVHMIFDDLIKERNAWRTNIAKCETVSAVAFYFLTMLARWKEIVEDLDKGISHVDKLIENWEKAEQMQLQAVPDSPQKRSSR